MWLANQALSMGGTDAISFATLPGDGAGWYKGKSFYTLYPEQVLEMTNSMLNPLRYGYHRRRAEHFSPVIPQNFENVRKREQTP